MSTLKISVKGDMKAATQFLDRLSRKQIPFATSVALNNTAKKVVEAEKDSMHVKLDRPMPNTVKGVRWKGSTKSNLEAAVFIIPAVAAFLRWQILGGTRPPRGKVEAVPWLIKLNQYGNIPGRKAGKLAKVLAQPDTFSGVVRGIAGIWQKKVGAGLKLLVAYEKRTNYSPRWPFYKIAEAEAIKVWPGAFRKAINFAVSTIKK